jgi:hypothetical protein
MKREIDELKPEVEAQKALGEAAAVEQESASRERMFRLYGWADMGITRLWGQPHDLPTSVPAAQATGFTIGNINLYFDFQPTDSWSSLIELRFTNMPDGTPNYANMGPLQTSTMVVDTESTVPWQWTKLGGVIIERAYIQYRHNDLLQVRVGQFLTPFGIWNVDHGTPTLIALTLPVFMVQSLFPAAQIGIEALGNTHAGDWDLGYMAYVSNGRTVFEMDPTNDKALGGRLYARTSRPYRLQIGLSAYEGRFSDTPTSVSYFPTFTITRTEVTAYQEVDVGLDLSLDVGPLRFRSELSRGQYVYEAGKRPLDFVSPVPGAYTADSVQIDWYGLLAYRLPFLNLEPYIYFEYYRWPSGAGGGYIAPSAGLNIYFTPAAQLRFQYVQNYFYEDLSNWTREPDRDKKLFATRLVLGF